MIANPTQTPDELAEIGLEVAAFYTKGYRISLRKVGNIFDDDIESWAAMGVMDAIRLFDPSNGASFRTYCRQRIHGAIIDGIRSRTGWRRTTGSKKINNPSRRLDEELRDGGRPGRPIRLMDILPDVHEKPTEVLDLQYAIDERLKLLSLTNGIIVRMYFMEGWTMLETANVIGISESRISQIISRDLRPLLVELFRDFIQEAPCQKQQK